MIPTLDEIWAMIVARECTQEKFMQWVGAHIDAISSDVMMRDQFASSADVARDQNGNLLADSVTAVMGTAERPRMGNMAVNPEAMVGECRKSLECLQWWADAEARIRYIKADAMMRAQVA